MKKRKRVLTIYSTWNVALSKENYACEVLFSTFVSVTIWYDFKQFMNGQIKQFWNLKDPTFFVSQHAVIRKYICSQNGPVNFGSNIILGISESIGHFPISWDFFFEFCNTKLVSKWNRNHVSVKNWNLGRKYFLAQCMEFWNTVSY